MELTFVSGVHSSARVRERYNLYWVTVGVPSSTAVAAARRTVVGAQLSRLRGAPNFLDSRQQIVRLAVALL